MIFKVYIFIGLNNWKFNTTQIMMFTNRKSRLTLIFFFFLASIVSFGQNSYYLKKESTSLGINLEVTNEVENSKFCNVYLGDSLVKYTPYEVSEYGFEQGIVYLSKEIKLNGEKKRVFLKRLHQGKMSLFYYRDKGLRTFFIEKDSSVLMELPKKDSANKNFRMNLLTFTDDCPFVENCIPFVEYRKHSLTKFIRRYNECEDRSFKYSRYGLTIGYGFAGLIKPSSVKNALINNFDLKYDGGITWGLFGDFPILNSSFSLNTELFFSKYGYSSSKIIDDVDMDLVINVSSIKMPIMIRYKLTGRKLSPFLNAGAIFVRNVQLDERLYEATITDNVIRINDNPDYSFIPVNQLGYTAGTGLEYRLNSRNSLFFELRYSKLLQYSNTDYLNTSEFNLMTSINF